MESSQGGRKKQPGHRLHHPSSVGSPSPCYQEHCAARSGCWLRVFGCCGIRLIAFGRSTVGCFMSGLQVRTGLSHLNPDAFF